MADDVTALPPRWRSVPFGECQAAMYSVRAPRVWKALIPRIDLWLGEYANPEQVAELRARLDEWEASR